ncbi:TPA: hypothetical protein I8Y21_005358 [Klebsiella oxytoca]|uniref:Uncharacterized protein n=1 Tax=Klebsiella oxytoca TaxID=571 RepID=A0AAN5LEK9_KLEOX|nr:hypothetical protein [Klebsiella oxytoca]
MMLITLELQAYNEPCRSRLTLGTFCPDGIPGLADVIAAYAGKRAIPSGDHERTFRGQRWRVRRVPAPDFMAFLREWRHAPAVNAFLSRHTRLVCTSLSRIPGMHCCAWVNVPVTTDPDATGIPDTGSRRKRRRHAVTPI